MLQSIACDLIRNNYSAQIRGENCAIFLRKGIVYSCDVDDFQIITAMSFHQAMTIACQTNLNISKMK